MSIGPGVWVTGPSRSGTSMVAGLFASHGVYFGPSISANEYNPKGYFESVYLKRLFREDRIPPSWPDPWFEYLLDSGLCNCGQSWGAKTGPQRADWILPTGPAVIVFTIRPFEQIARSRTRVSWASAPAKAAVSAAERRMDRLRETADVPIVEVRTDRLAEGEYDQIRPAFEHLTACFNPAVARKWIDPDLWDRNG